MGKAVEDQERTDSQAGESREQRQLGREKTVETDEKTDIQTEDMTEKQKQKKTY